MSFAGNVTVVVVVLVASAAEGRECHGVGRRPLGNFALSAHLSPVPH